MTAADEFGGVGAIDNPVFSEYESPKFEPSDAKPSSAEEEQVLCTLLQWNCQFSAYDKTVNSVLMIRAQCCCCDTMSFNNMLVIHAYSLNNS